jgi:hypothetical protein
MKFSRRTTVFSTLLVICSAAAGTWALAGGLRYATEPTAINISATPIASFDNRDPTRVRFGALEFRGGLALTSDFAAFGGISGLQIDSDGGRILAVTDRGSWLKARIVYDEDGKLAGLADAEMAPLLGANGKPLASQRMYDTESLTRIGDAFYVGIERVHRIMRFAAKDGFTARGAEIAGPGDFKSLRYNGSLECLASPPPGQPHAGKLVVVTEESLDAEGNLRSFVVDPSVRNTSPLHFTVKRSEQFDVSDCTMLPPGDLLLLERSYSPLRGVAMRIRRVPVADIKEGAVVDGPELIKADLGYQIDNMEGIAVHRNKAGETIITLVSDDNFSPIQRNILLQFALVD